MSQTTGMENKGGAANDDNDGDFSGIRRVQFNSSDSHAKSKCPDSKTCRHTRSCPRTEMGTGKIQFHDVPWIPSNEPI